MAGIFIGECIENEKHRQKINRKRSQRRQRIDLKCGRPHPQEHRGLDQQMLDGRGRHIPHHGGRHHDREDHSHDGVLRPKDPLKHVDKGDDEHKIQGRVGEIRPDVLK